jgi:hypothetical protein
LDLDERDRAEKCGRARIANDCLDGDFNAFLYWSRAIGSGGSAVSEFYKLEQQFIFHFPYTIYH